MLMQLTPETLKRKLEQALPGSSAEFSDLTGTGDHWQLVVISDVFEGKPLIAQHRMVKGIFDEEIQAGHLHALTIKTYTKADWEKYGRPSTR